MACAVIFISVNQVLVRPWMRRLGPPLSGVGLGTDFPRAAFVWRGEACDRGSDRRLRFRPWRLAIGGWFGLKTGIQGRLRRGGL